MAHESVELPDLLLFVRTITAGSLSAAGRSLKISPAVASKRLNRLENHLGVRLIQRTSRRLNLTEEGAAYYERIAPLLAQLEDAGAAAAGEQAAMQGTLRITATNAFGRRWLGPLAAEFSRAHPQVSLYMHLTDEVVDLLSGGYDLAVRIGQPQDSSLIARRVANSRLVLVAAPSYLKMHGTPKRPEDLAQHRCIPLLLPGRDPLGSDSGELMQDWARRGEGIARKSIWDVTDDLIDGKLVTVLDHSIDEPADIHVVYPSRSFVPLRVRRFIAHLEARLAKAEAGVLAAGTRRRN